MHQVVKTAEDSAQWWTVPQAHPFLTDGMIHVWRATLDVSSAQEQFYRAYLASDELERADRFVRPSDRQHFTVARGVLRFLAGRYLEQQPAALQFIYSARGKPELVAYRTLQFNVSHSHGMALYAFALERPVGIDIELIRSDVAYAELAARFFASQEYETLRRLPQDQQQFAFFTCWVRKEAYLKARGDGIGYGLDQFAVTLVPGEPAALSWSGAEADAVERWLLVSLEPDPKYAAALATVVAPTQVLRWQWSPPNTTHVGTSHT